MRHDGVRAIADYIERTLGVRGSGRHAPHVAAPEKQGGELSLRAAAS